MEKAEVQVQSKIIDITYLDNKFDLYKVLKQVVIAISEEILLCDSVGIFLPQLDGTFRGYVGIPQDIKGISIDQIFINPAEDLFYKEILEKRKYIYIPDTSLDKRPNQEVISFLGIKSIFALPISYENEVFGLVSLFKKGCVMNLTQKDIHAVESYIKIAAIAIRNAKLLSATHEKWEKAQARFFRVFKFNPVAMSLVSMDDMYVDVNLSWLDLFEAKKEEVVGKAVLDTVILKNNEAMREQYIKFKGVEFRNIEINITLSSGSRKTLLYTSESIELGGEKCTLNVFNDVTGLRKLEQEVSRYDRLNLIAQMAAGIAHEIRNPMTTVRGLLQVLKAKESNISPNVKYYEVMIEEIDRANGIITEFLSLSKEESYKLEPRNLNDIIDTIFPLLMADASNRNMIIEFEKGQIPYLFLDEKQIRQLVYNLVRNSIEAISSEGKIKISTINEENEVILAVEDNGSGIPTQLSDKVADPFFTTKDTGTGLGLPVCYSIAQRHNAVIEIERKEKGTRVLVKFKHFNLPKGDA